MLFFRARADRHESRSQRPNWKIFRSLWPLRAKCGNLPAVFSILVLAAAFSGFAAQNFHAETVYGQEIPDRIELAGGATANTASAPKEKALPSWVDPALTDGAGMGAAVKNDVPALDRMSTLSSGRVSAPVSVSESAPISAPVLNAEISPNALPDALPEELPVKEIPGTLNSVSAPPALPMSVSPAAGNSLELSGTNSVQGNAQGNAQGNVPKAEDASLDSVPESILLVSENDPQNAGTETAVSESISEPQAVSESLALSEPQAVSAAQELPKRELKTWEGTGLIPQNWDDGSVSPRVEELPNAVSPNADQLAESSDQLAESSDQLAAPLSGSLSNSLPDTLSDTLPDSLPDTLPETLSSELPGTVSETAALEANASLSSENEAGVLDDLPAPPMLADENADAIDTDLSVPDASVLNDGKSTSEKETDDSQIAGREERNSKLDEELCTDLDVPESLKKDGDAADPAQVAEIDTELSVPPTLELPPELNAEPETGKMPKAAEIAKQMGTNVPSAPDVEQKKTEAVPASIPSPKQVAVSKEEARKKAKETAARRKEEKQRLEKSFDSAIAAIEKPAAQIGKFHSMRVVSRAVLEESWEKDPQNGKIQTVSHEEPARNGKSGAVRVVKNGTEAASDVKRLSGPKRVRRLGKAPVRKANAPETAAETRFDLEISSESIEGMISSGVRVPQDEEKAEVPLVVRAAEDLQRRNVGMEAETRTLPGAISVSPQEMVEIAEPAEVNMEVQTEENGTGTGLNLFDLGVEKEKLFPRYSPKIGPQNVPESDALPKTGEMETPFAAPTALPEADSEAVSPSVSMSTVSVEECTEEPECAVSSASTVSVSGVSVLSAESMERAGSAESSESVCAGSESVDSVSASTALVRTGFQNGGANDAVQLIRHLAADSEKSGIIRVQSIGESGMNVELADEEVEIDFQLIPQEELEKAAASETADPEEGVLKPELRETKPETQPAPDAETKPAHGTAAQTARPLDILDEETAEDGLVEELAGTILNEASGDDALEIPEEIQVGSDGALQIEVVDAPEEKETADLPNAENAQENGEENREETPSKETDAEEDLDLVLPEPGAEMEKNEAENEAGAESSDAPKEDPHTAAVSEDELLLNFEGDEDEEDDVSEERSRGIPEEPRESHADALGELILETPDPEKEMDSGELGDAENESFLSVNVSTQEAVLEETGKKLQAAARDAAEKTARETARETAESIARKTADEAVENAAEKLSRQTAEMFTEQLAEQIADRVVERTVDEVMRRLEPQLKQDADGAGSAGKGLEKSDTAVSDAAISDAMLSDPAKSSGPEASDDLFLLEDPNESLSGQEEEKSQPGFVKLRAPKKSKTASGTDPGMASGQNGKELGSLLENSGSTGISETARRAPGTVHVQNGRVLDPNARGAAPGLRVLDPNARGAVPNVRIQDPNAREMVSDLSAPAQELQGLGGSAGENVSSSGNAAGSQTQGSAPGFVKLSGRKRNAKRSTLGTAEVSKTTGSASASPQPQNSARSQAAVDVSASAGIPAPVQGTASSLVQAPVQNSASDLVQAPASSSDLESGLPKVSGESVSVQENETGSASFLFDEEDLEERLVTLRPCEGVVLNANSAIRKIYVEDPSASDSLELNSTQLALIGKFPGQTRVRVEFHDEEIEPMLFRVEVQNGDPRSQTLASWAKLTEDRINRELPDAAVSIFLFQDRVFVKGKPGETVDPQRILSAVQKDYLRLKRESPVLNQSQEKTMLVNLLTAK